MDYIGSKEKVNSWIFNRISLHYPDGYKGIIFLDACSGSGAVSKAAANAGFDVIANDIMRFPSYIVDGSIGSVDLEKAKQMIDEINNLKGIKGGFFYEHYSEDAGRLYFTNENAKKLDAIRMYIEKNSDAKLKSYLLYCSLEAMSRVSNTTGVQAAFLKQYKDRAKKPIELYLEPIIAGNACSYSKDILALLKSEAFRTKHKEEILYIDPPYNERQYGPNYHLYETFVKYDDPIISGKTGLRNWQDESKSPFCSAKFCLSFTKEIIENTTAKHVFISYNSDGLMSIADIENYLLDNKLCHTITVHSMLQRRYKADASEEREYNNSILKEHLIELVPLR